MEPAPLPQDRPARVSLDAGSVVLLTGGTRGVTARIALALARTFRCHIELLGRTGPDADSDPGAEKAPDAATLRAALVASGMRVPAEVEAETSRILAAREVRATLDGLAAAGAASARHHTADVRDAAAVRAAVTDVRARHGRLDGVVHGAGVLEDGLMTGTDPASFGRVFATKVDGARALAGALDPGTGFLAMFGSVAGVFGNRGQAAYAAANDALDTFAHSWAGRFRGRVVTVDWGPWASAAGGMVTPELERAYARRGVPVLDPEPAVAAFLAELAHGDDAQVVLMPDAGPGPAPGAGR